MRDAAPPTHEQMRTVQRANERWHRLTAWGCAQRGVPYDPKKQEAARLAFEAMRDAVWPPARGTPPTEETPGE